eukprot:1193929-Amphidinium_carterae.1
MAPQAGPHYTNAGQVKSTIQYWSTSLMMPCGGLWWDNMIALSFSSTSHTDCPMTAAHAQLSHASPGRRGSLAIDATYSAVARPDSNDHSSTVFPATAAPRSQAYFTSACSTDSRKSITLTRAMSMLAVNRTEANRLWRASSEGGLCDEAPEHIEEAKAPPVTYEVSEMSIASCTRGDQAAVDCCARRDSLRSSRTSSAMALAGAMYAG